MSKKQCYIRSFSARLLQIYVVVLSLFFVLVSCKNKGVEENDIFQQYLLHVEVLNREVEEVSIDNFTKDIRIRWYEGQDKAGVLFRLTPAHGVSLVRPSQPESELDLNTVTSIVLSAKGKEINYRIRLEEITKPINEDDLFEGWTAVTSFGELPEGIKVYRSPDELEGKRAVAYIAVADISQGKNFHVLGEAQGYQTPTGFYESSGNSFPIIVNAGYFWDGHSLSMMIRDEQMLSPNGQTVTRSDGTSNVPFYPTRGVFGQFPNGSFQTDWVFTTVTPGTTFAYPDPAPNKAGTAPQAVPSADFPENGWEYEATRAIGGGPILIKGGQYKNTWEAELYDEASGIGATSNQPRTAIGITDSQRMILFVCEGRNMTEGVPGLTLENVASVLQGLGCVEALNLDGGGSTCMLVNGQETIKPSDGNQRNIVSAVGIR